MSVALYILAYARNDQVRTPSLQALCKHVQDDDLTSLRARVEALCEDSPDLWETFEGKHTLRRLASLAASLGFRDMVLFFLQEYRVPIHQTQEKLFDNDSHLTPLLCSLKYQDLALELLSLGTIDTSLHTYDGYSLIQMAIKARAPRVVRHLVRTGAAEIDVDTPTASRQHTALCTAAMEGDLGSLNMLLGMYEERGLLTEALMRPCDTCKRFEKTVRPFPLLYHAKNLATARLLMTWLGDSAGPCATFQGLPGPVHRAAAGGDLSLLKFYTQECGLSIDGPGEGECVCCTPLASACKSTHSTLEVVRYLLDNGADAVMRGFPTHCRSPIELALACGNKDLHRLILRFEAEKTEETTRNLMFQLEAMEDVRHKKPLYPEDEFLDLERSSASTVSGKVLFVDGNDDAPGEFVCPIELRLMVDDPVLASDGFTYSRAGLEKWILQRQVSGLPLTSPLTGEVMGAAFYDNKTHRAMVRRWVDEKRRAAALTIGQ